MVGEYYDIAANILRSTADTVSYNFIKLHLDFQYYVTLWHARLADSGQEALIISQNKLLSVSNQIWENLVIPENAHLEKMRSSYISVFAQFQSGANIARVDS